jgi:tRNA threonylcarbamoyladenosine biosynthesis protein TsaE
MLTLEAASEEAQAQLGARLAAAVAGECVIYLHGDLGAGKTTLVRGFLRGLGHAGVVKSPTYTLLEPYEVGGRPVCHLDLYRLGDPGELEYLGIRDLLGQGAVLLVEWPERGRGELPPPDLLVDIEYLTRGRRLRLTAPTDRGRKVLDSLAVSSRAAARQT